MKLFSEASEYALRAMLFLARCCGKPRRSIEIAEFTKCPEHYLKDVLRKLDRSGLVRSKRGHGGGYELSREASKITLLEVIRAIEVIEPLKKCPLKLKSHEKKLCAAHAHLVDVQCSVIDALGKSSIQDMVNGDDPAELRPLGELPEDCACLGKSGSE